MQSQCLISFGSNLGDREQVIVAAARRIAESPLVDDLRTSRLFTTPPVGGPLGQEPFLNAVGAFETVGSAHEILDLLQEIEQVLGRQRMVRWSARSIDLDVVLHGQLVGGGTGLIVPHPRYTSRRFVLEPACDVAGHFRDPRFGWTLAEMCTHLSRGAPSFALTGADEQTRSTLCRLLTERHGIQTFQAKPIRDTVRVVGNVPATGRSEGDFSAAPDSLVEQTEIGVDSDEPWVSAFVPPLPSTSPGRPISVAESGRYDLPRLVLRLQRSTPATRWPAPHLILPAGLDWPEYRLEVDDLDWAVDEVASALHSMRCPVDAETCDGHWW